MTDLNERSKLYSKDILLSIAKGKHCPLADRFNSELNHRSLLDLYDCTINHLGLYHRNDLYFRHLITQKIFLSNYVSGASYLLSEVRAGNSIVDLVVLNESSTVYEIKSDVDNLKRLSGQLSDYLLVFDQVYVVFGEKHIKKVINLDDRVGIYTVNNQNDLIMLKPARSNKRNVNPRVIFKTLRKPEYLSIIHSHYGKLPSVPNTKIYAECNKLFNLLSPEDAHEMFVEQLKKRAKNQSCIVESLAKIPNSIVYPVLIYNFSKSITEQLVKNISCNRGL